MSDTPTTIETPQATPSISMEELAEASRELDSRPAEDRVAWGLEHFKGSIALTSSFGAQSAVLLHMVTRLQADVPVVFLDTGYLFKETYKFVDQLTERLGLNLKVYRSPLSASWQEARWGKLWENGVEGIEKYNQHNKVEPMERAINELGLNATISGIRRQQSSTRESLPILASRKGSVKNDLPYHPLWDEGYVSIGDWHTSRKLTDGMSAEESRFFGLKRECGLNEDLDFVI